jgi:AcrR family transcriptional regulator
VTPPRAGLDRDAVLDAATSVIDSAGVDALSLKAVADTVGVRTPSLYNHVDGLEDVRAGLRLRAYRALAARQRTAAEGAPPHELLRRLSHAQRAFAREHPGLFAAIQPTTHRGDVPSEIRDASEVVLEQLLAAVAAFGLHGEAAIHAVRTWRSSLLGFIALEGGGHFGMPQDVDASFDWLIETLELGFGAGRDGRPPADDA